MTNLLSKPLSKHQASLLGSFLWIFGMGLIVVLTFETGAPIPIFAGGTIWIGTWLTTKSKYMDAPETARQSQKNADN